MSCILSLACVRGSEQMAVLNLQHRKSCPEGSNRRGWCRSSSGRCTIELFEGQLTADETSGGGRCLPLSERVTSVGSIEKVEFWAETRSAESAETTTKERILEQLSMVVIVELVAANTLADGSVSVLSETGRGVGCCSYGYGPIYKAVEAAGQTTEVRVSRDGDRRESQRGSRCFKREGAQVR